MSLWFVASSQYILPWETCVTSYKVGFYKIYIHASKPSYFFSAWFLIWIMMGVLDSDIGSALC